MSVIPWRSPRAQPASERSARSSWLRAALGPVSSWPEAWQAEWHERVAMAEVQGELVRALAEEEVTEMLRAEFLGRAP